MTYATIKLCAHGRLDFILGQPFNDNKAKLRADHCVGIQNFIEILTVISYVQSNTHRKYLSKLFNLPVNYHFELPEVFISLHRDTAASKSNVF